MGQPESRVFSAGFTIGLLAFLLAPFAIKSVIYAEPWPAVVLPSGAITISVKDGVATFGVVDVSVIGPGKQRQHIDARSFLTPVPVHYLNTMLVNRFGQDERPFREVPFKRGGLGPFHSLRLSRVPPTPAEREQARLWLRDNAKRAGLTGDTISIRTQNISVAMKSGQELSREDADEILVELR